MAGGPTVEPLTGAGAHFDVPDDVVYLNSAYMTPKPRHVAEAGVEAARRQQHPWTLTAPDFFDDLERIRALVAGLVGGDADGASVVPAASHALSAAAANVPATAGQRIVVLAEQYPSNVYPWRDLAARTGAEVVAVARPEDGDWTRAVVDAVDERTAAVAVPHCHFSSGALLDLHRVGARAREVGTVFVVDATQSLGVVPLDAVAIGADMVVAAGYKWLLGPYGVGYAWTAPQRRGWRPLEHHWAGRAGSEDFARLTAYTDDFRPGARRFDGGEASSFVLVPMALAALQTVADWSVPRVAATLAPLTALLVAGAEELGLAVTPEPRVGHIVGLHLAPDALARAVPALAAAQVHVSVRGETLRVSPYVFNTEQDVARLLETLGSTV